MARIVDVAERAGVSPMTVSRVLNGTGRVSPATRERVLRAIEELNYVPNQIARSLVQGHTNVLGLIIPDITNPFFTTIARGVEDAARKSHYKVLLCNSDEDPKKEREYIETLVASKVDALVMAPVGDSSKGSLDFLQSNQVPVVLVDRRVEGVDDVDLVTSDSVAGTRALVEHLLGLGHRRIALVAGPQTISTARDRRRSFLETVAAAGVEHDPSLEVEVPYTKEGGMMASRTILELPERPTAVFCSNNAQAVGLVLGFRQAGVRIPDEIAVCCFDDVELASMLDPFLTVTQQPAYTFGTIAVQLLLERMEGNVTIPRRVVLEPTLTIRRSTIGGSTKRR
ncbi:MAG: LacI family DNA-binding transcriptional regulator [Symbiobacterium sp.]|uniref:LacI family DNA-binding transcriptional regulator n=1 Tax=Symbiobacterium sp. TaxID=1971213 RepID=UPI0034644CF6